MAKRKTKTQKKRAVLVTTRFRGVFFGYVEDDSKLPEEIKLSNLRNCIYWHQSCEGFHGLAVYGPNEKCTLGAINRDPSYVETVYGVTYVGSVTKEAEKKWKK